MGIEKVKKSVKLDIKEALRSALPQVFEDNKINLNELKSFLSGELVEKEDDRFYFNWANKSGVLGPVQAPAYGTLKVDKKKSVDFDKSENLMIVGENLETLKLLLKPYFNKVKMIYIDPPYNTGKDFIYKDNFKEPLRDYLEKTKQIDSEGNKLTTNTEASGRYHSDWLNFMYSRLFVARSLLKEDGVIFVSIDDNEVHHLRMIMDEIFGEENLVAEIVWHKKRGKDNSAEFFSKTHEYLILYARNKNEIKINRLGLNEITKSAYKNPDNDSRGEYRVLGLWSRGGQGGSSYEFVTKTGKKFNKRDWLVNEESMKRLESEKRLIIIGDKVYRKLFLNENKGSVTETIWLDTSNNANAADELKKIFGFAPFDTPKPIPYIRRMLELITKPTESNIVLDFFAGAGTTGHALWDLNKQDGGDRKFVLVQLDEPVDEKTEAGKNALKLGLKTVADVCIERLKRVSKIYGEDKTLFGKQDFGFKVLRLDKSNFNLKDEFDIADEKDAKELKKKYLEWLGIWVKEPLVAGWKPLDLAYEVMLKDGFDLNSQIEEMKIKSNDFLHVIDKKGEQEFYISLDDKINKATIEEIRTATYKSKTFVFLDKALTDNDKINLKAFVRAKVI